MEKRAKIVVLITLGITCFVGSFLYFSKGRSTQKVIQEISKPRITNSLPALKPSPTSFPFQELTIPYLRTRSYDSSIAGLVRHQNKANYTSYTTSYQSDGLKINALLTEPTGTPPVGGWPAIVFVHGYIPPSSYQTTTRYIDHVDYLARNGFVVLKIDLRGHGESEGEPNGAYQSSDYIVDTLSAIEALKKLPFVHKDKIGLWGHSMAGNIIMRSLAVRPEIPAIAIWGGAVYTYTDMKDYGIDDGSYRPPASTSPQAVKRRALTEAHGQFDPDDEFWKLVPATNFLDGIQGAVGIFHAVNDPVVSVEYGRNLNKILDETQIPHELHEYPDGGHNISGASFSRAMQDTVNFFQKNL